MKRLNSSDYFQHGRSFDRMMKDARTQKLWNELRRKELEKIINLSNGAIK